MKSTFNGLGMNLGSLPQLSRAKTRSISAENPKGKKGKGGMATEGTGAACARDLGRGWKVSPSVRIEAGQTYTLADVDGPGAIQSMWLSGDVSARGPQSRFYILRIYWDNQTVPSVECPCNDFFASGWAFSRALSCALSAAFSSFRLPTASLSPMISASSSLIFSSLCSA